MICRIKLPLAVEMIVHRPITYIATTHKPRGDFTRNMHSHGSQVPPEISRLAQRIPKGSWDTHMHVVDPTRFQLDKAAQYTPSAHTLDQAKAFLGQIGIQKMVIVQPSIYGNDNSCTLDGLRHLGPKNGRAVVQFDPANTSQAQLQEWHDMGVRGVRLNFKSVGAAHSQEELQAIMKAYADTVRPFGWPLELYVALETVPMLEKVVATLPGTKIIIDHFGHPPADALKSAASAHDIDGFSALLRLLRQGNTWVKISASYRLAKDPNSSIVESLCKEILRVRADRCVFATDWPHTRFEDLQVSAYLEKILDWCEEEGVSLKKVLVENAEELFDARN